jgi:hypothetical protein
MQMYCTFVAFVNQHFPGLPTSGTHCIMIVCEMLSYVFMFLRCTAPAWRRQDFMRHVGDLGNIKVGDDGVAKV